MREHPLHSAIWARKIVDDLRRRGIPVARLLAEAGVHQRNLNDDDARLPIDQVVGIFELAAVYTGDDSYAFRFAQTVESREAGLISYVGLSAATVGDAIVNIARYRRVFSDATEINVNRLYKDGTVKWYFRLPASVLRRQQVEWSATSLLQTLRTHGSRTIRPDVVRFKYPRNSNLAEYERFYGCAVEFGAHKNFVRFRTEDLRIPLRTADDRLHGILRKYCEEVLQRHAQSRETLIEKVERLAADRLAQSEATVTTIARELGMSARTLARRLGEAGTSFRKVIDDLRRALALRYLRDSHLSIHEITFLLGYNEVSSFNHAFKRWTGKTPGQMR